MKKIKILGLLFLTSIKLFSQIDMADSTVQVIGYWDMDEKYSFNITEEKYQVIEFQDTTEREIFSYVVDVTIIDSTENSYTIEWFYRDFNFDSTNEIMQKLAAITDEMKIIIKTDEFGTFLEVVNWKDIRKFIKKGISTLENDYKEIPNMDKVFAQVKDLFSTKESIESAAIPEIQQFYTYHGAKYKLGEELNATMKLPNLYGGEPFDSDLTVWLDEINPDDNDYIIRMNQNINPEQLADATFNYLSKMSSNLEAPEISRDDFENISNTILTASIIHGTGWIIYSVETKEVRVKNAIQFEERRIDMK